MTNKTTPCESRGYKVGDRFTVTSPSGIAFREGSIVELNKDDGTSDPLFKLISGRCRYNHARSPDGTRLKGGYTSINNVTKINNQEETAMTNRTEQPTITTPIRDNIGARVQAVRSCFFGKVPAGTKGTVVAPRDSGVNVVWDNGYAVVDGSATTSPEVVKLISEAATTPHQDARYIVRIVASDNPLLASSFVSEHRTDSPRVSGKESREHAKKFTYEEVLNLLKHAAYSTFEVLLAPVKTGRTKPVRRGNNGWAVGDVLFCNLSGHPFLTAYSKYTVTEIDKDGDELTKVDGSTTYLKYGASSRNEYTIQEGK